MGQPGGIRNKISFWFYLLLAFMVATSAMTYGIVSVVEKKHFVIEKADAFLENILEVRRMEKNYLLYRDELSMQHWTEYVETVFQQLVVNKELFVALSSLPEIHKVQGAMQAYMDIFEKFCAGGDDGKLQAEKIREQGNLLTTLAEDLIVREHQTIHRLLALIRNSLLMILPLLVITVTAVAAWLGKGIVSSLSRLEIHAATIADGNFVELQASSDNLEINSLTTALNRMCRELRIRQQQLVRAEKLASLGTMLAGVAHEFNNPLSNISGSAQILADELSGHEDPYVKELVGQIRSETNRAAAIVRTLLSLVREDKFHRDHYALKDLCQEIVLLLQGQLGKDVEIKMAVADNIKIFADKRKIQQLLINLLKNSIDALNGPGIINIKAWENQTKLKIVVSDNGPGMPKQVRQKIFDPFFTTKETGEGSGLGLFVAHDIVVQHGGDISVTSKVGEGTLFTIVLPRGESADGGN